MPNISKWILAIVGVFLLFGLAYYFAPNFLNSNQEVSAPKTQQIQETDHEDAENLYNTFRSFTVRNLLIEGTLSKLEPNQIVLLDRFNQVQIFATHSSFQVYEPTTDNTPPKPSQNLEIVPQGARVFVTLALLEGRYQAISLSFGN